MQLNDKQLKIVKDHTINQYPKEAVIGITKDDAIILENIHSNPEQHFRINQEDYYNKGFIGLIHSHTYNIDEFKPGKFVDVRSPSKKDMQTQVLLDIPFGIVSTDGTDVSDILWFPDLDAPLAGLRYISGVYDCYTIVQRYYWQKYKILLDQHPRSIDWRTEEPDIYRDGYKSIGFYDITEEELEIGDLIVMNIGGHESHGALYMGNNKIAQHFEHRLSITDDSYTKWRKKMSRFLRHKDKPKT